MAPEFHMILTFFFSFFFGMFIFSILYKIDETMFSTPVEYSKPTNEKVVMPLSDYNKWFNSMNVDKYLLNDDELRYANIEGEMESEWLYKKVNVVCVVYTSNAKNARAINETWSRSCNNIIYYSKNANTRSKLSNKSNATSSFHLLCDVIRKILEDYPQTQWALFVKDDMFVIAENLRYLVAPLDPKLGHYLGHAINFWNVDYNIASSGFVLSYGALQRFVDKFPNTSTCMTGGKYWKQEDLYLGKHLRSMNIEPVDTRDKYGYTAFLGYDLDKMMFPMGSTQLFTIYYNRALYPVKCCGEQIITFPVLSSTEMYTYHYMIYTMGVFKDGALGNRPPPTSIPETQVWQDFLRQEGLPLNLSNAQYEEHWYIKFGNATALPGLSKKRDWGADKTLSLGGPNKSFNLTNMPEVLESMLSNYGARKT